MKCHFLKISQICFAMLVKRHDPIDDVGPVSEGVGIANKKVILIKDIEDFLL